MCMVAFINLGNNHFILTSNREETPIRKTILPKEYDEDGIKSRYPIEESATRARIGLSKKNRLVFVYLFVE